MATLPVRAELPSNQLSPEMVRQLQSMFMDYGWRNQQKSLGNGGLEYLDPASGMYYIPQFQTTGGTSSDGGIEQLTGFTAYDSNNPLVKQAREDKDNFSMMGAPMLSYDAAGNYKGQTEFQGAHKNSVMDQLLPLGMMALPFALTAMGVAGAGAAGAGATAGEIGMMADVGMGAGGASTGAMGAGGLGGAGGIIDLGGGLSMGADGAILGETLAGGGTLSNAAIEAMINGVGLEGMTNLGLAGTSMLNSGSLPPVAPPGGGGGGGVLDKLTGAAKSIGSSGLLGPALTLGGAALGAQGTDNTQTQQNKMDPRLDPFVYGQSGLFPRAQGLLDSQSPQAQQAGAQMMQAGGNLLSQPVAGNGYGSVGRTDPGNGYGQVSRFDPGNLTGTVQLERPDTPTNPYLSGLASDIQRRTQDMLGRSFNQIRGNAVGVGGLGGSRQGIAESEAMRGAADSLQGQLAGLYGQAYQGDQGRALQKYGMDQGFAQGQRGQDLQRTGMEFDFYGQQRGQDLQRTGLDLNFYQGQRGQDLQGAVAGGGLLSQGLETQWGPLQQASNVYRPYTGLNSSITTGGKQGGGLLGALGGALGTAQFAKNAGWW